MQDNFVQIYPGDLADADENFFDTLARRIALARDEMLRCEIEANTVVLDSFKFGKLIRPEYVPTICGMKVELAPLPDEYDFLVQYKTPEVLSLGDLLRKMDDEHLAEWISERIDCARCRMCQVLGPGEDDCATKWLRFLQQPADRRGRASWDRVAREPARRDGPYEETEDA